MFNLLRNLVSKATSVIKGVVAPKPAPAPAAKPYTPPKIAPLPAPSFRPIANYGESAASVAARTAVWQGTPAARAQSNWLAAPAGGQGSAAAAANALRAEVARKAELKRQAQAKFDTSVAGKKSTLTTAAQAALSFLKKATGKKDAAPDHPGFKSEKEKQEFDKWFSQQTPERQAEVTAFNNTKNEYERGAKKNVDSTKKGVTGWFGYSANTNARKFAEDRAIDVSTKGNKRYEDKLNPFLKEQASRGAKLQAKLADGSLTQAEIDEFNKWEADNVKSLEYTRAATTGMLEGYNAKASEKLKDPISRAGSWFNKNVMHGAPGKLLGGVWKYTLGQGTKDIPSLATAPSRAINTVLNATGLTKQRNYHEGKTDNSKVTSVADSWAKTFNQRNFNWAQPQTGSDVGFEAWYKTRSDKSPKMREVYRRAYDAQLRGDKAANYVSEALADPLLGVSKLGKLGKPIKDATKTSDWYASATKAGSKLKETKAGRTVGWLNAKHETYSDRKNKFIQEELDDIYTKRPEVRKLLNKWQTNKTDIKANEKVRISEVVGQEFAKNIAVNAGMALNKASSEKFLRAVQEVARGKSIDDLVDFTPKQRGAVEGMAKELRTKLDDFYKSENMPSLPRTAVTMGKNGKKKYTRGEVAPLTYDYRKNYLPQYVDGFKASLLKRKPKKGTRWFTKEQKAQRVQSAGALQKSITARQYGNTSATQNFPVQRDIVAGRKDIAENFKRIDDVDDYVKRTKWEKTMRVAGKPMQAWKKAVLLGNPAWYVNNELFNQIQGVSAGGLRFLKNQRGTQKYMDHLDTNARSRMLPSKAQQLVRDVGSNVSREVGGSKLGKLASKQETRSRAALYRTFRQDGLSHDKAIKKVNDNLFDYSTKNIERPIKSIFPFYSWSKGLGKAAVKMPLQKPKTALAFNDVDRNQTAEYDKDFDSVVDQLKGQGYSEDQIKAMREENRKFYGDKTRVGGADGASVYMSTPFNAFSERGLSNMGANPFLAAIGEAGDAEDYYGRSIKGRQASLLARLTSKFPQPALAQQAKGAWDISTGKSKPTEGWIGKKGSEGYGLTKEKQGYDKTKPNYSKALDKREGLLQNTASFFGSPRFSMFDKNKLVETKKLAKVTDSYFALDTKNMEYAEAEAARKAIFKKYGVTPDEFYKGILSKYDSENTKRIKTLKEDAAASNKSLFDEYGAQPQGTRNTWATNKLRELVKEGYFDKNPFLKSFDWMTNESVSKADKQMAYNTAKSSGDWSAYNKSYGKSTGIAKKEMYDEAKRTGDWTKYQAAYGKTQKSIAYASAKKSGDWSSFKKSYGEGTKKSSPHQFDGKYFKTAESRKKYIDGKFWKEYAQASKADRKSLLASNPQYDDRKDWTDAMWDADKTKKKATQRAKLHGWGNFASMEAAHLAASEKKAQVFIKSRKRKTPKLAWRLS